MRILSLCTSAGLFDKPFLEEGHDVVPGCEIQDYKRDMYHQFNKGTMSQLLRRGRPIHQVHDIKDLLPYLLETGQTHFDGIIGGIT